MELVEDVKEVLIKTAIVRKGSERRLFMARTVRALGEGGHCLAERELGGIVEQSAKGNMNWNRGLSVLMRTPCEAGKRSEAHLPNLLSDITAIVAGQSQADPQCRHRPSVHTPDGNGSAPPIDCPKRLQ
jgi:hypothetical protein